MKLSRLMILRYKIRSCRIYGIGSWTYLRGELLVGETKLWPDSKAIHVVAVISPSWTERQFKLESIRLIQQTRE